MSIDLSVATQDVPIHALVPAAGQGSRSGLALPKQYALVHGEPVLAHTLRALRTDVRIASIQLVLADADRDFERFDWSAFANCLAVLRCGGDTRAQSVLNGLTYAHGLGTNDWILVHDAARPCLAAGDLSRLIDEALNDPVGAILAAPVADTLKRADGAGRIRTTVDRSALWHALTPQMFRHRALLAALSAACVAGEAPTDEAAAMERQGLMARLVHGSARNFKITYAEDLDLAARLLEQTR